MATNRQGCPPIRELQQCYWDCWGWLCIHPIDDKPLGVAPKPPEGVALSEVLEVSGDSMYPADKDGDLNIPKTEGTRFRGNYRARVHGQDWGRASASQNSCTGPQRKLLYSDFVQCTPYRGREIRMGSSRRLDKTRLISPEYAAMNAEMHTDPNYGANAQAHGSVIEKICKENGLQTVLDYGCGKGTLKATLSSIVSEYDPSIPEKADDPRPADLVVALDVLEHIEPLKLSAVLDHIRSKSIMAVALYISLRKAKRVLPDGRNAHLIVKPEKWWLRNLGKRFSPVYSKVTGLGTPHLFYVGKPLP